MWQASWSKQIKQIFVTLSWKRATGSCWSSWGRYSGYNQHAGSNQMRASSLECTSQITLIVDCRVLHVPSPGSQTWRAEAGFLMLTVSSHIRLSIFQFLWRVLRTCKSNSCATYWAATCPLGGEGALYWTILALLCVLNKMSKAMYYSNHFWQGFPPDFFQAVLKHCPTAKVRMPW